METSFRVSAETVSLSWDDEQVSDIVRNVFSPWQGADGSPSVRVSIEGHNGEYVLSRPGQTLTCWDRKGLCAHLVNMITDLGLEILDRHIQIHASCVELGGNGALLVGSHGSGKTTLALAAICSGFRALSDDAAILSQDLRYVLGFPRPFGVREDTWNLLPRVVPEDCPSFKVSADRTLVFFYSPGQRYYASSASLKHIVFPVRGKGATRVLPLGETEALGRLLPQRLNFAPGEDRLLGALLTMLGDAPPLEIAYSDHWDVIRVLCELLR